MTGIIDFHTHAFPDELAERAMKHLELGGSIPSHLNGTVNALLSSMDKCGIEKSIVCSIATKPSQFDPIFKWSKKIMSDRIIPFPSFHPTDPEFASRIAQIKAEGFKGIKFHPYYQEFNLDDEKKMFPIYENIADANLMILMHTGFDFAFPFIKQADPEKIVKVLTQFPNLKLVTSHLGAWKEWEEVERFMVGKPIYMELSFALEFLDIETACRIMLNHPKQYLMFGTDSPWTDQLATINLLKKLNLGQELETLILRDNALSLLNSI